MTAAFAERINGHLKGRAAPPEKLEEFTFEGTGRTVQIRKLSALARDEIRRQVKRLPGFEEPQPPMVEVDYGTGKIAQPHRGHPVYQELLADWNVRVTQETGERIAAFAIRRGVVCDIDEQAVATIRQDMALLGAPLDEYDDHYVYVAFVCVGPQADYNELLNAVFNRSIPSPEAVQAHKDSFRGNVREQIDLAPEPGSTE